MNARWNNWISTLTLCRREPIKHMLLGCPDASERVVIRGSTMALSVSRSKTRIRVQMPVKVITGPSPVLKHRLTILPTCPCQICPHCSPRTLKTGSVARNLRNILEAVKVRQLICGGRPRSASVVYVIEVDEVLASRRLGEPPPFSTFNYRWATALCYGLAERVCLLKSHILPSTKHTFASHKCGFSRSSEQSRRPFG